MKKSLTRLLASVMLLGVAAAASAAPVEPQAPREATVVRVTEQRVVDVNAYGGDATAAYSQAMYFAGTGQLRSVPTKVVQTIKARTADGTLVTLTGQGDSTVQRGAVVRYNPTTNELTS